MYEANGWVDWPTAERDANSPMNETFFGKWFDRDRLLAARSMRPIPESGTLAAGNEFGTWMPARLTGPDRIWVPPWATHLTINAALAVNLPLPIIVGIRAVGEVRPHVGSSVGAVMRTELSNFLPADGTAMNDGDFFRKQSVVALTEAERGAEVDFFWQAAQTDNVSSLGLALPYPWLWTNEEAA